MTKKQQNTGSLRVLETKRQPILPIIRNLDLIQLQSKIEKVLSLQNLNFKVYYKLESMPIKDVTTINRLSLY